MQFYTNFQLLEANTHTSQYTQDDTVGERAWEQITNKR